MKKSSRGLALDITVVSWLAGKSVPPSGYGGIERMTATMTREFIRQGHNVTLIAPEGSNIEGATVIETTDFKFAYNAILDLDPDIVWDNSCWSVDSPARKLNKSGGIPCVSTTHVNHAIGYSKNVVYLSYAQRDAHSKQLVKDLSRSPVIRVPTDPTLKRIKGLEYEDYFLYIGSIAEYKGVLEAAELAKRFSWKLKVAGPGWGHYADRVFNHSSVEYVGIVDGAEKIKLIQQAYAVCCLHNSGEIDWIEPGCGVVGEAIALGTPVAAFYNGCLPELIKTGYNGWLAHNVQDMGDLITLVPRMLPKPSWLVEDIVEEYLQLFHKIDYEGYEWD